MGKLIRLGRNFTPDEVLPFVVFEKKKSGARRPNQIAVFSDQSINMASLRYQTFAKSGITCKDCGLKGQYFALEKHSSSKKEIYHLNLYAVNDDGKEVMFTKDHIFPKSRGGRDILSNLQTLCEMCNLKKDDIVDGVFLLKEEYDKIIRTLDRCKKDCNTMSVLRYIKLTESMMERALERISTQL